MRWRPEIEKPEFEDGKQPDRAGADDDYVGFDWFGHGFVPVFARSGGRDATPGEAALRRR